ncbi:hypothetical protein B2G69_08215 [Methylorubrum zatmanii]|nr:hypothetical protein [Methylorubrum zatmanii]ARO54133.1 hypothetical protein B2G69_08215 [Methylorubrum zatmanii]
MQAGRYVYERLTEEDRTFLRGAMWRADGYNESDDLYCALANYTYFVPQGEGGQVTEEHMIEMLDRVAGLRREVREIIDYTRILRGIERHRDVGRLAALYVEATGVSDEEIFGQSIRERGPFHMDAQG